MENPTSSPLQVIDSHAHLYSLQDVPSAIAESRQEGVRAIVVPGEDAASNGLVLWLAMEYPGFVLPAVGYHPACIVPADIDRTVHLLDEQLPACVALGEVGLDYKARVPKTLQKSILVQLLGLAYKHSKPVILHVRYAHESALSMLQEASIGSAVFHGYNGSLETLSKLVAAGYYISATPSAAYNERHAAAVSAAPLRRILVETDTPIAWQGCSGRPVECWLALRAVAKLKRLELDEVAATVYANTLAFLGRTNPCGGGAASRGPL